MSNYNIELSLYSRWGVIHTIWGFHMNNNFVNRKDRIIASAIEIISEAGLSSLSTKTLAMKENMSESLLYRYFGGIDEVLVEVVETFTKFDKGIIATLEAKDIPHFDKAMEFTKTLSTYYAGYKEISAIVLNYEELLHNVNTREAMAACLLERMAFMRREFTMAIEEGEIVDTFTPEELTNMVFGTMYRALLNRRLENESKTHEQVSETSLNKFAEVLRIKK
ncbi:MAG: TetR family transcriptional regulator [Lachnospiraceae bacterium]|nr:TetR family transcriptional regulator [Lachnospiraceae bacterium]